MRASRPRAPQVHLALAFCALNWIGLVEKEFNGKLITVQYATYGQKPTVQPVLLSQKQAEMNGQMMPAMGMGAMGGRMQMGGYGPMSMPDTRPNDWICGMCNNVNFHWRTDCNRCKVARTEASPQAAPCMPKLSVS